MVVSQLSSKGAMLQRRKQPIELSQMGVVLDLELVDFGETGGEDALFSYIRVGNFERPDIVKI